MAIELKMPALSPTMEEGTLAKWLVKEGDQVKSGDLLAEIETDKATMEFEAIDEGTVAKLVVAAGTDGVKVGQVIAIITEEGEDAAVAASSGKEPAAAKKEAEVETPAVQEVPEVEAKQEVAEQAARTGSGDENPPSASASTSGPAGAVPAAGDRLRVSPLARRIAEQQGLDLASATGSGPNGRIVKADLAGAKAAVPGAQPGAEPTSAETAATPTPALAKAPAAAVAQPGEIPHEAVKLSGMRKVIARRLTESKQQVPHIYLTVDINLDRLLKLRTELNKGLESRGVKLSVNDMLIKALAVALEANPKCNVSYAGDQMLMYSRADISVAVSIPAGLITPIITDAGGKSLSKIATEMKALAERAKAGKLAPHEYQGGTASLSNMGMFGIKNFDAVINPPQGMIMAIGAGEKRPYVVDGALAIATVMSATGSFDHRAIDGADGAALMKTFKELVENPLGMLA